jgi:hypothetical protein
MKKLIAGLAIAVASVGMTAGAAYANSSPGNQTTSSGSVSGVSETGWIGSIQGGKNNTTQQYKTTYSDPVFGPVSCAGVNQKGKSISSPSGQDSFTCTSTVGALANAPSVGQQIGWLSDFYALQNQSVLGTATVTATDGVSYTAVASY